MIIIRWRDYNPKAKLIGFWEAKEGGGVHSRRERSVKHHDVFREPREGFAASLQ